MNSNWYQNQNQNPKGNFMFQQQQNLTKQEIAQIQDAELSNDTMCRVLTLGEKYALGKNEKYGAYNMSNSTGEDLLRLFVREIEIFRLSYEDFVEEHGEYKFPRNLSKNEILQDINSWKNEVEKENIKYYDILGNLINGNYKFSLKDEIKKLKKKKKNVYYKEGDKAKNLQKHVPVISHHTRQMAKNAEENYIKDKNYQPEAKLYQKPDQRTLNKLSKTVHEKDHEEDESRIEDKDEDEDIDMK